MAKNSAMTPIIFGASGLLGGYLYDHFTRKDYRTIGTFSANARSGLCHFDFRCSRVDSLPLKSETRYIAILCSAIGNISYINQHPADARAVNVEGTQRVIAELSALKIPVLFISSDNVFSGEQGGYTDRAQAEPVSEYGKQKKEIEDYLQSSYPEQSTTLRIAKIIGNHQADGTILNDIVQQLQSGSIVKAASDLVFNPTAVKDIIRAIEVLLRSEAVGTFNFCNPEPISRLTLTEKVAQALMIPANTIQAIQYADIDPSGKRPLNTTMVNSSCFQAFSFTSLQRSIAACRDHWAISYAVL